MPGACCLTGPGTVHALASEWPRFLTHGILQHAVSVPGHEEAVHSISSCSGNAVVPPSTDLLELFILQPGLPHIGPSTFKSIVVTG